MKDIILGFILLVFSFSLPAQTVSNYIINAEFFPNDAQMYYYSVSPNSFIRANSIVEFSEIDKENVIFFLHGELKIDSILHEYAKIEYTSEKVFYDYNYSMVALKVKIKS